jgi:hypothetical protein
MMKNIISALFLQSLLLLNHAHGVTADPSAKVKYVSGFPNSNHPEICYWFVTKDQLENDRYLGMIDQLADKGLYTMAFLTARNGVDFYKSEELHPVLAKLVEHAHKRGLKIGLQLWSKKQKDLPLEDCDRLIVEGEATLDENGAATYTAHARNARSDEQLIKSDLLRAYAFKQTGDGFYDPTTLRDITDKCVATSPDTNSVQVDIKADPSMKGRTVYLMTQHYYNHASNLSPAAAEGFAKVLEAYRDIPFDGVALDEFHNLAIIAEWDLKKTGGVFRERYYSPALAGVYQSRTGTPLERALFDMRYAPEGQPEVRMRAINNYMDAIRSGTLIVERAVQKEAKNLFGPETFAGFHSTAHNNLTGYDPWATGINWWSLPREYGQTDEGNPFPTMLGVGFAAPKNAMYNMYYHKNLDNIVEKALECLRYGIRTHYHAVNDAQGWGVSMEKPETLAAINPVERCARLLNRFNPSFPDIKLLVLFGTEAVYNWYPDASKRGAYDINDKLGIQEKADALWKAGYGNVLIPSDLIESGKLRLNARGKPEMNGHVFDAVVYLSPQYARESALKFLEDYTKAGGKLMIDGAPTRDFQANDVTARFSPIANRAAVTRFDVKEMPKLGVPSPLLPDGCRNEDGSCVFTDLASLKGTRPASFKVTLGGSTYSGEYHGLAAIKADGQGDLEKFTAAGFRELRKDGKVLFRIDQPADIFITRTNGGYEAVIDDGNKSAKPRLETP